MKIFRIIIFVIFLVTALYYFSPERKLPHTAVPDSLVVNKSSRTLMVSENGQLLKTYKISLGKYPRGAKLYDGDFRTPEGSYTIREKESSTPYERELILSYPNAQDLARAREVSRTIEKPVALHGLRKGFGLLGKFHRFSDWTDGSIALTNTEIEELYNAVPEGTKIEIYP